MRILQLCNRFPFPPKDGYSIAVHNLTKGFSNAGVKIKMLTMNTKKHFIKESEIPGKFKELCETHSVYVDNSLNYFDAFINLFTKRSYNVSRFQSSDFKKKLIEILNNEQFDIIQLEGLYLCLYIDTIRKYSNAKVVLRAHNIEYKIWELLALSEQHKIKSWYLKLLSRRLEKFEMEQLKKTDSIVTISTSDNKYFKNSGCRIPIFNSPAGVEINKFIPNNSVCEFPSLFHIGALNWIPNQKGILWFLANVWPGIHKQYPDLKFYIAGRYTPDWFYKLNYPNVIILGEIEDAMKFMNSKAIMIVPLFSGSGMRIKIVEGMALGKTIVSTTLGAEGIDYTDGKNILIANTADEFKNKIIHCIENENICETIGNNAIELIGQKYSNELIVADLLKHYDELICK